MKNDTVQQIVVAVSVWVICQVILLVAGALLNLLPAIMLSDLSTIAPYLITLVISVSVTAFILFIMKRRKRVYNSNYRMAVANQMRPLFVVETYTTTMWDVVWEVIIGSRGLYKSDQYPYVTGPFCPADHYELDSINKSTLLGSSKRIWRCGSCGAEFPRPKDQYLNEANTVGKKVMADHTTGNVAVMPSGEAQDS